MVNDLTFDLTFQVVEIAIEIDNLVQHSYSVNVKPVGMPETAETGCKMPTMDTTKRFVRSFEVSINDIAIAHRVPVRNATTTNDREPIICRFVRQLTREEVMSRQRDISRVDPKDVGLGYAADLLNSTLLDHFTFEVQELLGVKITLVIEDKE